MQKGPVFRPAPYGNDVLAHTGLWTFTRITGIDARGFSCLRPCPEMYSLHHRNLILSQPTKKDKSFFVSFL
jgi:hypothetical protein